MHGVASQTITQIFFLRQSWNFKMQQMVLYVLSRFSQRLLRRCVLKDRNLMQLIILLDNQEDSELTLDFFFYYE